MLTVFKQIFTWWNHQTIGTRLTVIFFGKFVGRDRAGNKYYEQQQIIATQKQAIEAGLIEKQELKNKNIKQLQSIIKLTESIKILSLKANYESPEIIYKYDTIKMDSQAFLRVPTQFNYRDEWIYISGSVRSTGVFHDSIKMNNSGTLMLGYKKSGFLKKSPVVTYESSNPYFEIIIIRI